MFVVIGSTFMSLAVIVNLIRYLEGDITGIYQALSLLIIYLPVIVLFTLSVHESIP